MKFRHRPMARPAGLIPAFSRENLLRLIDTCEERGEFEKCPEKIRQAIIELGSILRDEMPGNANEIRRFADWLDRSTSTETEEEI